MCQPLRSSSITKPSSLLRADPPKMHGRVANLRFATSSCAKHRYFLTHGFSTCDFPLTSRRQVPTFHGTAYSLVHAVFMPETTYTVIRFPVCSSWRFNRPPPLISPFNVSTPHRQFTFVHLPKTYLTE